MIRWWGSLEAKAILGNIYAETHRPEWVCLIPPPPDYLSTLGPHRATDTVLGATDLNRATRQFELSFHREENKSTGGARPYVSAHCRRHRRRRSRIPDHKPATGSWAKRAPRLFDQPAVLACDRSRLHLTASVLTASVSVPRRAHFPTPHSRPLPPPVAATKHGDLG